MKNPFFGNIDPSALLNVLLKSSDGQGFESRFNTTICRDD
jgi:hypothetical protein